MGKIGTIAGVVVAGVIMAGGVAMAVQESRNWILDEIAKTSNIHKTVVEENDKLRVEITDLKTQKTELLTSLTELDNQINATEDKTTIETLTEKKTAILAQVETLNARIAELESQQSEYKINVKDITFVHFTKPSEPEGLFKYTDIPLGNISFNKSLIESEFVFINVTQVNKGALLEIENVNSINHEKEAYELADNFEYIPEIYDATGRMVTLNELNNETWYTFGVTYKTEFSEDGKLVKLTARIDLVETISNENNEQSSYNGTWTYTQVGESDSGLCDGAVCNVIINEDKIVSCEITWPGNPEKQIIDLSQAEVTELENGLKFSLEDEIYTFTLIDENTLHVSLCDNWMHFDATRVTE